nr:CueP family metal-binding protein [Lentibacillus sp. JNUCC-1]
MLLTVLLAACGNSGNEDAAPADNNEPEDIKTLVNDYSTGDYTDVQASITSEKLVVTDSDENETAYDLPDDEFFVSVAPFINQTHPCFDHSLTGCQGELVNKDIDVVIEDMDGNVIVDKTMTTPENGFLDFWLPRDETFRVQFSHDGKTVESELSTNEEDGTCVTDLQMT